MENDKYITAERLRELLKYDPETGIFSRRRQMGRFPPNSVCGAEDMHGYLTIMVERRRYQAHRLAWLYVHGEWPRSEIDHINGMHADNRIANLRDVSRAINAQNKRRAPANKTSSSLIGAQAYRGRWRARVKVGGREHTVGYFNSETEAHNAYVLAKRRLHEGCTL